MLQLRNENSLSFTLIELLVVIAIIGILAALIFPVLAKIREQGRKKLARTQIGILASAIDDYHSKVGTYPVSDAVMKVAVAAKGDFTYGGSALDSSFGQTGSWSADNSEVIAILLDREKYPNTGAPTVNFGHVKNNRKEIYLTGVEMVYDVSLPGIGADLVYRDPWGNPYIISLDLTFDGKCRDALYQKSSVSRHTNGSGFNGLFNSSDSTGASDAFEYAGGVMVWSLGPDKKADINPANTGVNQDNILSWK